MRRSTPSLHRKDVQALPASVASVPTASTAVKMTSAAQREANRRPVSITVVRIGVIVLVVGITIAAECSTAMPMTAVAPTPATVAVVYLRDV